MNCENQLVANHTHHCISKSLLVIFLRNRFCFYNHFYHPFNNFFVFFRFYFYTILAHLLHTITYHSSFSLCKLNTFILLFIILLIVLLLYISNRFLSISILHVETILSASLTSSSSLTLISFPNTF